LYFFIYLDWYLKDVGVDEASDTMRKARKFILDHGGIEDSQMMTKYKLAAFGQYEWHLIPYVPLFIFKQSFPYNLLGSYIKDYIAQWVYPHLTGLAYLRYHKTIFPVSRVCLS
jgi:squalene cyclase